MIEVICSQQLQFRGLQCSGTRDVHVFNCGIQTRLHTFEMALVVRVTAVTSCSTCGASKLSWPTVSDMLHLL